jgi:hypothetical protein
VLKSCQHARPVACKPGTIYTNTVETTGCKPNSRLAFLVTFIHDVMTDSIDLEERLEGNI